jgi:hypothetical protein
VAEAGIGPRRFLEWRIEAKEFAMHPFTAREPSA